ncbi:armadillo-like helical domain-containing protein 3 [Spinachia spinachia]
MFFSAFICLVMNNPELPLDPNLQTSNLLITFLKYASIVMQDTKDEHRLNSARLCLIILTCIAEDQYADPFLHDDNTEWCVLCRPCVRMIHKLLCYQKKCRIRLHYTWRELWSGKETLSLISVLRV